MWLHTDSPDLFARLDLFFIYFQKFVFDFVRFLAMWVGRFYIIIICIFSLKKLGKKLINKSFRCKILWGIDGFRYIKNCEEAVKQLFFKEKEFFVFRCVLASLNENFFIHMSVCPYVRMSVSTKAKTPKTTQNCRKTLWSYAGPLRLHLV